MAHFWALYWKGTLQLMELFLLKVDLKIGPLLSASSFLTQLQFIPNICLPLRNFRIIYTGICAKYSELLRWRIPCFPASVSLISPLDLNVDFLVKAIIFNFL